MGKQLPQWYLDEPPEAPTDAFFLTAFFRLSTCRAIGMTAGPIPWWCIRAYADAEGLDYEVGDLFTSVIYAMDETWQDWIDTNKPKMKPSGNVPSGGKKRERTSRLYEE